MPLRRVAVRPRDSEAEREGFAGNTCGNQYSVERLCALHMYSESRSMLRVLGASVGTIVVPLLSVLALDILPLQSPNDGWDKNVSLWCREFVMTVMVTSGALIELSTMAPAAELSTRSIATIGLIVACGHTASMVLIAAFWAFPIPFAPVVTIPVWLMILLQATTYTIGVGNLRQNSDLKVQVLRFVQILGLESCLFTVYPIYSVVFASLSNSSQLAFLFLLPVIKYMFKRLMKHAVADLEDIAPAIVATVDFFNALYQSKCMQSSRSILAAVGIVGIDMAQNILSLYNLFNSMRDIQAHLNAELLSKDAGAQPSRDLTGKEKVVVLKRTLELLWRCELILLVEYVEAAIPMMYAVYLAILHQLPNAKYYPDTVSMDSAHLQQAITSILIYGVLELVSLVCVHLVLKRRFKLSPLHQVAFTLESEWQLIQGAFTTWVVVVLPLTLEHHGADFTFRFAWVS